MEFHISIPIPAIPLCDATLQTGLARNDMAGSGADQLGVGRPPQATLTQTIWATEGTSRKFVVNYPVLDVIKDLLKATPPGQTPLLEIGVGDDTFVDYMKLTLVY